MEKDLHHQFFNIAARAEGIHALMEDCVKVMDNASADLAYTYTPEERASEWFEAHIESIRCTFFVSLLAVKQQMSTLEELSTDAYAAAREAHKAA